MTVVMLCLGEPESGVHGITNLLSILLSSEMEVKQKKQILSRDYGFAMTQEIEKEVSQMCDYSKGVEEKGIQKGIQEGTFRTLCSLVKEGLLKLEDAAGRMNLSQEEFSRKMKEAEY